MAMSNGVTGGVFANLADLQASRPREDTQVSLNGDVYTIDQVNFGEGIAVNSLFANPVKMTLTSLLNSTRERQTGDIVEITGYSTAGDGGAASWKATGNTITASQTPAQLSDAKCSDAQGNEFEFLGNALFLEVVGVVIDGVSDSTTSLIAAKNWSNRTTKNTYLGIGTVLTEQLVLEDEYFSISGLSEENSIFKLKDGDNRNCVQITGTGLSKFRASKITFNQNSDNQTAGHGLRSAGCSLFELDNVTIINSNFYGIGLQTGTSNGCKWNNITIDGCGSDAIDIKDLSSNNGMININGLTARNFGLINTQSPALDIRGQINASNINIEISGDNYGVRYRGSGVNGRAGEGVVSNVNIQGDGANASHAIRFENDGTNAVISNVAVKNTFLFLVQAVGSSKGIISNFDAQGIFGGSCVLISGSDFKVVSGTIENTGAASRITNVDSNAVNAQFEGITWIDNTAEANPIRIEAGANDCLIDGTSRGGGVNNLGTNTTVNVRLI